VADVAAVVVDVAAVVIDVVVAAVVVDVAVAAVVVVVTVAQGIDFVALSTLFERMSHCRESVASTAKWLEWKSALIA